MAGCLAAVSLASATAIMDGDFDNRGCSTISAPPNAADVTLEAAGGNSGPRLNITKTTFQESSCSLSRGGKFRHYENLMLKNI